MSRPKRYTIWKPWMNRRRGLRQSPTRADDFVQRLDTAKQGWTSSTATLYARHPALARRDAAGQRLVLAGLDEFREHLGGRLTITLLSDIGRGIEVNEMRTDLIERAIEWLAARGQV